MTIEIDEPTKELLQKFGFTEGKNEGDYQKEIDGGYAHVDFRKENGRRWAIVNRNFVKDPDTIEVLKQFKEERDKSQSQGTETKEEANSSLDVEPETVSKPEMHHVIPSDVKSVPAPTFDYIKSIVGDDLLEIFGDTGTGKSKFVHALALEAIKAGKKVYFLDTERNLSKQDIDLLGANYKYTPVFSEIKDIVLKTPPKVDLLIIDSIGLPILTKFAMISMKEKGTALLDLIAVVGSLKEWAYKNNALAVVTNQPESEFGKDKDEMRKPFGDKACFAAKEIWITRKLKPVVGSNSTKCSIESFRSRSMKAGLSIMQIEINDSGTIIRM